jgi:hypothetical protein
MFLLLSLFFQIYAVSITIRIVVSLLFFPKRKKDDSVDLCSCAHLSDLLDGLICPDGNLQLGFMLIALIWKFDFSPFMILVIAILNDGELASHNMQLERHLR